MRKQLITVLGGAGALVLALAGPAAAHIEPTIEEAPAGGEVTFALIVPHGCDDPEADTTRLEVQMPEGITEVVPEAVPGWDATIQESDPIVVVWTGGPLPHDQFQEFGLSVAMPDTPGETVLFPTVQTCEGGQEVSWLEETPEGGEEPEHPAPAITLTEAAADHSHGDEGEEPADAADEGGDEKNSDEASGEASGEAHEDEGTDALAVVALIVGALGLVLGAYAVTALRRAG
jgi:periplasmic copper chaperone A